MGYAGNHRYFTYASWVLSAVSALVALVPFVYIWKILQNENWELCLADGSDDAHAYVGEYCKRLAAQDSRIVYQKLAKNEGISGNTNECYKLASGEFIGLFDHDDILHPCALYEYVKAINEKDADFIYCDEATFKSPDINKMITMTEK